METNNRMGVRAKTARQTDQTPRKVVSKAKSASRSARLNGSADGTDTHPAPTLASFFSGIGGFDLGFDRAGFRVTFQCEINAYCRSILRRHWQQSAPQE